MTVHAAVENHRNFVLAMLQHPAMQRRNKLRFVVGLIEPNPPALPNDVMAIHQVLHMLHNPHVSAAARSLNCHSFVMYTATKRYTDRTQYYWDIMHEASVTSQHYILVADDDPSVRQLLVRVLHTIVPAAQVFAVSDGIQALVTLQRQPVTMVITDYHMPGASGLDIVHATRAAGATTPIVVISAYGDAETPVLAAGANFFLLKPFSLEQLTAILRIALGLPTP